MNKTWRYLIFDLVWLSGLSWLTAWLVELVKPGLVSNFFDIHWLLGVFVASGATSLVLASGGYRLDWPQRIYLGAWGLLLAGLFATVALRLVQNEVVFLLAMVTAALLVSLALWGYRATH